MPSVFTSKYLLLFLAAACFFGALAILDLRARALSAYLEGEKYMAWAADPGLKKDFFDKAYAEKIKTLERGFSDGSFTRAGFEDRKNLLETEKAFKLNESSAKYAYIWYKTAARDFTPPETSWSKLARSKSRAALELWKTELKAGQITFEDYMLE